MSAETKLELLGLIDEAVADGWAHARRCRVLDLADVRGHRCWRKQLRDTGSLQDGRPGGGAVHGLPEWEEQAILDLIETWGPVDRSHRKLAHRGSYTSTVFVSPSTVLRVAIKNQVKLPGEPFRPRPGKPVFPEITWEKNRIWIWDATHFTRCKRVAYTMVDIVAQATGSATCSRASRPTLRRSCCSLQRLRIKACSACLDCRPSATRTGRSWSPGQTTERR